MPIDRDAIARGCGAAPQTASALCRRQLDLFKAALAANASVTVGCTQEQPLFEETAAELGRGDGLAFANLREAAGWSKDAAAAGPKMAALLAAAAVERQDFDGVLEISCEPFLVGADDAIGRAEQTLARGIVARPAQQRAHGLLRLLACRALARPLRGRLGHGGSSFRAGAEAGVS